MPGGDERRDVRMRRQGLEVALSRSCAEKGREVHQLGRKCVFRKEGAILKCSEGELPEGGRSQRAL